MASNVTSSATFDWYAVPSFSSNDVAPPPPSVAEILAMHPSVSCGSNICLDTLAAQVLPVITRMQWGNYFAYVSKQNLACGKTIELTDVLLLRDVGPHKLMAAFAKVSIDTEAGKFLLDGDTEWVVL